MSDNLMSDKGNFDAIVIGGGLAGSEAAWQLAQRDYRVGLYEMRPVRTTGAHVTDRLGELVCSNSLGSKLPDRATGILQSELRILGSLLLSCAEQCTVPAGGSLAVDRQAFAELVTSSIAQENRITVIREEVTELPTRTPTIVATGPLTSPALSSAIIEISGQEHLYFYDAISPIVVADTIDMSIAFQANRYDRGESDEGDYINCPMSREEYEAFVTALVQAETAELRDFEREDPHFFEGCMPIEQLAKRGMNTLAFGPMRPVGIINPHTGRRPYAVVQLRQDNVAASLYNIVGFQTNIRWGDQEAILRQIPGLSQAEFIRMGQMHRNTYLNAPALLEPSMQFRHQRHLFFAGQITGVEGYVGNIGTGLLAAINMARHLDGQAAWIPPRTTMLGALCHYVTHAEPDQFQPMKANLGILPDLSTHIRDKSARKRAYAERALADLKASASETGDSWLVANLPSSNERV